MSAVIRIEEGAGPLVAAAIHNGHDVRPEVEDYLALGPSERLREEDPFTEYWTAVGDSRIIALRSRFEFDLNRSPDQAVYKKPEDAWGLEIWRKAPPPHLIDESLGAYHAAYAEMRGLLTRTAERHGRFIVYDLHSYNYRRAGPDAPPDDPAANPDVNVGTGTMDRHNWAPVVDAFIDALRSVDVGGRRLDVRENVKFRGGYFPQWVHSTFPGQGCAIAIECKKFFMNEWTGEVDHEMLTAVRRAVEHTTHAVLRALGVVFVPAERT